MQREDILVFKILQERKKFKQYISGEIKENKVCLVAFGVLSPAEPRSLRKFPTLPIATFNVVQEAVRTDVETVGKHFFINDSYYGEKMRKNWKSHEGNAT